MILSQNQSVRKEYTLFARNKLKPFWYQEWLMQIFKKSNKVSKYIFFIPYQKRHWRSIMLNRLQKKRESLTCFCLKGNLFCVITETKSISTCILVKLLICLLTHFAMMTTFTAVSDRSLWRKSLKNVSTLCIVIYPQRMICLELSDQH